MDNYFRSFKEQKAKEPFKKLWNVESYDDNLNYVWKSSTNVIDLLFPKRGENILDFGCGTGHLTNEIKSSGAYVKGIDISEEMIERARNSYPNINFGTGNIISYTENERYDGIFSNAVLHWIPQKDHVNLLKSVHALLKPHGRFVAEFDAKGNVSGIISSLDKAVSVLKERNVVRENINISAENLWYHPSLSEYKELLENNGFNAESIELYERFTPLSGGEEGFTKWVRFVMGFGLLDSIPKNLREGVIKKAEDIARETLYKNGGWHADHKRIIFKAVKH